MGRLERSLQGAPGSGRSSSLVRKDSRKERKPSTPRQSVRFEEKMDTNSQASWEQIGEEDESDSPTGLLGEMSWP
eukprot:8640440-Pyramimonas_sp.AAC.1